MLAYNFRPSRPKAAHRKSKTRLVRGDTMFPVERGVVSPQKRDLRQLDDSRSRSNLHRESNMFKTTSQREDPTVGEQEIRQNLTTRILDNGKASRQTWPAEDQRRQFAASCFDYVQNYHHYILDVKKLQRGEQIPYLSPSQATVKQTTNTPKCLTELPKRSTKSASKLRRVSWERKDIDVNSQLESTLQDLIVTEIEDELNKSHVLNLSCSELRAPLATPVGTPRSSIVHSSFPDFPHSSYKKGMTTEIQKPYMSAFQTRIPPLKSCESINDRRSYRRSNEDGVPDYQRFRILCDAFRPCTPQRTKKMKHKKTLPSQVLDFYTRIVNVDYAST
ncbi:uncharacterized protein LOC110236316 [Exaiptasia diaphana]|uniref:Uncharacterized protein n=1 Tax=Exaiptasia diaphana TaxID=2652724 RepID=A0A913X1N8_EXADI|nr:uncharacterized protein LOC110236316 [Exaiptasia diaphana]